MNILITGGASGLGAAITAILGCDVSNKIWFTFNKSEAEARQMTTAFPNAVAIKCDFRLEEEVASLANAIPQMDLDVLINNAYHGEFLTTHFHKIAPAHFINDFKENIVPVIEITQAAITVFRKKKNGKIITILTSALSDVPPVGSAAYVANKAYLQQLTKVWAGENAKFNISSNSVFPSFMQTNLTAGIDERMIEQIKENHPHKKLLTVNEVAETVLSLVNSTSDINGVDIIVNAAADPK